MAKFKLEFEALTKQANKNVKELGTSVDKVGEKSKSSSKKIGTFQKAFKKLDLTAVALVAGGMFVLFNAFKKLGQVAIETIKVFIGFDRGLSRLKAISKGTAFEIGKLSAKAKELGSTTEFTASQVTELQIAYAKFGFSADEIDKVTEATLDLATATGEDLTTSAEVVASTLRGFGLNASETKRVVDVMAESFTSSALDLEKFRESMKLIAPIAKAGNISIETTTALLAKLADAGLSGSIAGTGLKNLLSQLTNENSKLSKQLGFTVRDSDDVAKAFALLAEKGIDLSEATELVDERSKAGLLTLINSSEEIAKLSTQFKNAEGSALGMASTIRSDVQGSLDNLGSAFEGLQIAIGEKFGKAIKVALDFFADFVRSVKELVELPTEFEKNLRRLEKAGFNTDEIRKAKLLQEEIEKQVERRLEIEKEISFFKRQQSITQREIDKGLVSEATTAKNIRATRILDLLAIEDIATLNKQRDEQEKTFLNSLKQVAKLDIQIATTKGDEVDALKDQRDELQANSRVQRGLLADINKVVANRKELVEINKSLITQEELLKKSTEDISKNLDKTTAEAETVEKALKNIKVISEDITPIKLFEGDEDIDVDITSAEQSFKNIQEMEKEFRAEALNQKEIDRENEKISEQEFLQFKLDLNNQELTSLTAMLNNGFITQQKFDNSRRKLLLSNAKLSNKINTEQANTEKNNILSVEEQRTASQIARLDFSKDIGSQLIGLALNETIASLIPSIIKGLPFPINVAVAGTAPALAQGLFSALPKFEDGIENGLVQGGSFTGDNTLVRANAGEAIFNRSQQDNLIRLGRGESLSGSSNQSIDNLASKIDLLTDEIVFKETQDINITNELNVTASDLLEVTRQGEINTVKRSLDG